MAEPSGVFFGSLEGTVSLAFSHFFPLLDQLKNSAFSDLLAKHVINAKFVQKESNRKSRNGYGKVKEGVPILHKEAGDGAGGGGGGGRSPPPPPPPQAKKLNQNHGF